MKKIDPKTFGLSKRTILYKEKNEIIIESRRKSRIIMKDGVRLVEVAEKIKKNGKVQKVALLTNAPICSKTKTFLINKKISILET